jgi:hypothetical protein
MNVNSTVTSVTVVLNIYLLSCFNTLVLKENH